MSLLILPISESAMLKYKGLFSKNIIYTLRKYSRMPAPQFIKGIAANYL
jgi:hypothetical protein